MITVWNTPIAASVEQILRDLKLMLFAEGLLRDQNNTGSDVMVTCPFHKGGHERKPSCGVSLKEKIKPVMVISWWVETFHRLSPVYWLSCQVMRV